jgi:hypothetical protein
MPTYRLSRESESIRDYFELREWLAPERRYDCPLSY